MKKCPTCNRTFTDDALSFCLDDGSPLLSTGGDGTPPAYDPGATIQYTPGRDTSPPPPTPAYTPSQPQGFQAQPPSWSPMPPPGGVQGGAPPRKKSKGLYWIIGIIAVVVVLGIGGIALVFVLAGMSNSNANNGNTNNSNTTANSNTNANNSNSSNSNQDSNSNSNSSRVYVAQDDFSITNWWVGSISFGKAEYVDGEYQLSALGGYLAVYGPTTYDTKNATTRVTTRSVSGVSPDNGYGLTVFSELKKGQLEDYAFVIRTNDSPAFRVYLHKEGKESTLVNWTEASQIRTGSATNQLEVRATDSQLSFYINGQYATSIADTAGYKGGIAGFYASGTTPIAFDDLEIYR